MQRRVLNGAIHTPPSSLPYQDLAPLLMLASVCKAFNACMHSAILWEKLCTQMWPAPVLLDGWCG